MTLEMELYLRDIKEQIDYKTYLEVIDINRNDEIDKEINRLLKD